MEATRLPNFLVIGVEKGGTTWLYMQLKHHPEIFLPESKEIHFFNKYNSNLVKHDYFQLGIKWYTDFFKQYQGQRAIGEVTPMYICDPEAPFRIQQTLPNVKLIVLLRNPVHRAYSHYWMAKQKNHTKFTFREVIQQKEPRFIGRGLYYKQLKVYYALFPPEQIMAIFYEEVFKDPEYWLVQICKFLGVDESFYLNNPIVQEKVFPASGYKSAVLLNLQNKIIHTMRRNKFLGRMVSWFKQHGISDRIKKLNTVEKPYNAINEEDAIMLYEFYKEDMHALSLLLKRELPFSIKKVPTLLNQYANSKSQL
jgi:hypothetical protein